MPSELHEKQNQIAAKWLKKNGFSVIATNTFSYNCRERIDCIGFKSDLSCLIESKVSRSDFMADKKKPERIIGNFRFYICPEGMLTEEDMPEGWCLLWSDGKKVTKEFRPKGNLWCKLSENNQSEPAIQWRNAYHDSCKKSERSILFSSCRRLLKGEDILR